MYMHMWNDYTFALSLLNDAVGVVWAEFVRIKALNRQNLII